MERREGKKPRYELGYVAETRLYADLVRTGNELWALARLNSFPHHLNPIHFISLRNLEAQSKKSP